MAPVVTDPHNLRGLRRDGAGTPETTPLAEPDEIEAALEVEYAAAEAADVEARSQRIAALLEQKSEAVRQHSDQVAEAVAVLEGVTARYLAARAEVPAATEPYLAARELASYLRVCYEESWALAHKLGLVGDEQFGLPATRIEPSAFPDEIRYRLQSLSGRW